MEVKCTPEITQHDLEQTSPAVTVMLHASGYYILLVEHLISKYIPQISHFLYYPGMSCWITPQICFPEWTKISISSQPGVYSRRSEPLQLAAMGMCEMRAWKQEAMKQIG